MKKEGLLISIITSYWNTLEETLCLAEVLVPQLKENVEWIIVDDGCDELELDKLKSDNVKVFHLEKNSGGASKPRNVGLDKARGEYITFIDSDDMVANNYVDTLVNKINNDIFDYCYIGWKSRSGRWQIAGELPDWNCAVWCRLYKRSIIGNERFNTGMVIAEDKDFNDRVISGVRACIADYIYIYNDGREGSITNRRGRRIHKNAFCFSLLNPVGGAETYLYYIAKKYKDLDICVYYQEGDEAQIARLKKYVRVYKWYGEEIFCEKMFYNYNPWVFIDHVHAKEHLQVIHTDYKKMNMRLCTHPKITGYIGVTNYICKETEKNYGITPILCYNPVEVDHAKDKREVLRLVSATRLSNEKGKSRMEKLCSILDMACIPYVWTVFTEPNQTFNHPNVFCVNSSIDIMQYIKTAHYLVQLSNNVERFWICPSRSLISKCACYLYACG